MPENNLLTEEIIPEAKGKKLRKRLFRFLLVNIGCVIYALSISLFLDPNNLAPGGVSGISIILNYLIKKYFDVELGTGLWILILNVPILILGAIKFKWNFTLLTIYATAFSSFITDMSIKWLPATLVPITSEPMLAAIAGGAAQAVGMGLVLRGRGSTGGFDIIVKVLRQKYKHIKSGAIYFFFDTIIIAFSAFVYHDIPTALYATIGLLVSSFLLDYVLYGNDSAKLVYIISEKPQEISEILLRDLEVGVTYLNGIGVYSGNTKRVIMTVVHKPLYPKLRNVVKKHDPNAFMIITNANEIFGLGFKNPNADEM